VGKQLAGVGHLGNFPGMNKGAKLDDVDSTAEESFDPADFLLQRHYGFFCLQAIARPYFVDQDLFH